MNVFPRGFGHSLGSEGSNLLTSPFLECSVSLCDFLSSRQDICAKEICTCTGQVDGREYVVMLGNKTHFSSIAVTSQ